jgi:hypothetical protein
MVLFLAKEKDFSLLQSLHLAYSIDIYDSYLGGKVAWKW